MLQRISGDPQANIKNIISSFGTNFVLILFFADQQLTVYANSAGNWTIGK
jgi:hypothetical protein